MALDAQEDDKGFGAPAYDRIARDVRSRIASGEFAEGQMLPGRRSLAAEYRVSLPTLERAVASLVADGSLRTDLRRGTFVRRAPAGAATAALGIMAPLRVPTTEDSSHNGSPVIVGALERAISKAGSRTSFFNLWRSATDGDDRIAAAAGYQALVSQGVSVVVAVNAFRQADLDPIRRIAVSHSVPLVVVNDEKVSPPLFAVHYDHADAAHQAATHLLDAGCRKVVFFSARTSTWGEQRWRGVRDASVSAERLIDATNRDAVETDAPIMDATQGGLAFARRFLSENPDLFSGSDVGVVAANDQMAWGFIEAAAEKGALVARDYLIVGFDDMPESRDRGLSSMRPPLEELGSEAAALALQAVREPPSARRICLHSELVARLSSRFLTPTGTR